MMRHARVQILAHRGIRNDMFRMHDVTYLVKAPVSMLYAMSIRTMLLVRELEPVMSMSPSCLILLHTPWNILQMEFQYEGKR